MASTDPWALPSISYDETELRAFDLMLSMPDGTARGARGGVRPGDPGFAVTVSAGVVSVTGGVAALYRSGQGLYRAQLAATSPGTLAAANSSFSRIDLVYLRVWDTAVDSSGLRKADTVLLTGTASATPSAPTPGATEIYIPLATITVPTTGAGGTGSATVSQAVRPYFVAPGGILPTASTAEPSSGGPGGVFYDSDTDTFRYFKADGTTKANLLDSLGGKTTFARKSADSPPRASTTTLAADPDLAGMPVAASQVYAVRALIFYSAHQDADLKLQFSAPSGASMIWHGHCQATGTTGTGGLSIYDAQQLSTIYQPGGADTGNTTIMTLVVEGTLTIGGTAGSFGVSWAQSTSNAVGTILRAGSYLQLTRMT